MELERAGNAALEEIIMCLKTREQITFLHKYKFRKITLISHLVSTITGFSVQPNKAIVGKMHLPMNLEFIKMEC